MERRKLQPEQITVPGEYELGNESILQIYFRVFDKGHGEDLPPVIVVRSDLISSTDRQRRLKKVIENKNERLHNIWDSSARSRAEYKFDEEVAEIEGAYKRFDAKITSAPYYLIDGNHRSAAATLANRPIIALELQCDKDISKVRKMVERGRLFNFPRDESSLIELVRSFEEFILGGSYGCNMYIENFQTVRERVNTLVSEGNLPKYMVDTYKRK